MARPRTTLGPASPISNSRKRAWFWKSGIWSAIIAASPELPRTVLSDAQFEIILASYPGHVGSTEDVKNDLEKALTHALALPNFYHRMHLRKIDLKQIREAGAHVDALLKLFDSSAHFHWFLKGFAEDRDLSCVDLLENLHAARQLIDLACDLLPRRQSGSVSQMQRRLLTKGLSYTWWFATETVATRSMKTGTFGDNLICILRVLSEFGDKFNFLGNLTLEDKRLKIASRMLEDIDRTKARGMF